MLKRSNKNVTKRSSFGADGRTEALHLHYIGEYFFCVLACFIDMFKNSYEYLFIMF